VLGKDLKQLLVTRRVLIKCWSIIRHLQTFYRAASPPNYNFQQILLNIIVTFLERRAKMTGTEHLPACLACMNSIYLNRCGHVPNVPSM
jgi:hypothetical protein